MSSEIILSKAKKRLFDRQEKIVFSYLDAKSSKLNITEWKNEISEKLNVSIHAINYTIRPANLKRILDRSKTI